MAHTGVMREIQRTIIDALAVKDHKAAKGIVSDLLSLYGGRSSADQGSARLRGLTDEIATLRAALDALATSVRRHEEQLRKLTSRKS